MSYGPVRQLTELDGQELTQLLNQDSSVVVEQNASAFDFETLQPEPLDLSEPADIIETVNEPCSMTEPNDDQKPAVDPVNPLEPFVEEKKPIVDVPKSNVRNPKSLAVAGIKAPSREPQRIGIQQALNSWSISSGLLRMIIMHPGFSANLEDKLAGVDAAREMLDAVAINLMSSFDLPAHVGLQEKIKRHTLPLIEAVWGAAFSEVNDDASLDEISTIAARILESSANLFSADPEEMFVRSNTTIDLSLARFSAASRLSVEFGRLVPIIEKYASKGPAYRRLFWGDDNATVLSKKIFTMVENQSRTFLTGIDMQSISEREQGILYRVALRQTVNLMSGILQSPDFLQKLSQFAKSDMKANGVVNQFLEQEFKEWASSVPCLSELITQSIDMQLEKNNTAVMDKPKM